MKKCSYKEEQFCLNRKEMFVFPALASCYSSRQSQQLLRCFVIVSVKGKGFSTDFRIFIPPTRLRPILFRFLLCRAGSVFSSAIDSLPVWYMVCRLYFPFRLSYAIYLYAYIIIHTLYSFTMIYVLKYTHAIRYFISARRVAYQLRGKLHFL